MNFSFLQRQTLPISLEKAWNFFSDPNNLPVITPPYLKFTITSKHTSEKMYAGQIITYKVRPILSIPLTWITEITHVQEPHFFVDEQRHGPYRFWHHQHHFKSISGGVEITDLIHYQLPLGWIGCAINRFKVKRDLQSIFKYRAKKLTELFGSL